MGTSEAAPPPFARVAPALFIGNARAAGATELLVRAGITLCVNVSRQQPGPRAPGAGMKLAAAVMSPRGAEEAEGPPGSPVRLV